MKQALRDSVGRLPGARGVYRALRKTLQDLGDIYESVAPTRLRSVRRFSCHGLDLIGGTSWAHRTMADAAFEPAEIALVQRFFPYTDVLVDVGANIGLYACLARRAGKHAIAIEPQAKNLTLLYANLNGNGESDFEIYPLGLADRTGLATLHNVSGTGASLIEGWASSLHSQLLTVTIPLTTLDILLAGRLPGQRLFVKIDVEGAEHAVLCGGIQTLGRSPQPLWLVEVCLGEYHPHGPNPNFARTFELFWQNGYDAHAVDANLRRVGPDDVTRWVARGASELTTINYLFVPKGHPAQP